MSVAVKICGMRRPADVRAALDAGADRLGFTFAVRSRRAVSPAEARRLAADLPGGVAVGVFEDASPDHILRTCRQAGIFAAQVHGRLTPSAAERLSQHLELVVAHPGAAPRDRLVPLAPFAAAFLLDSRTPGSGEPWSGAPLGPSLHDRPTWLAGGLTPETVGAAILHHRPAGVDVASGVEGPDGQIDAARLTAFVRAARAPSTLGARQ